MNATSRECRRVVVLDFDGVLCDSIQECTLVAYLAHEGLAPRRFVEPGLAGVPGPVIARVRSWRPFVRQLAHFVVAFTDTPAPRNQADFADCFAKVPPTEVEAFVDAASAVRAAARRNHRAAWLARHRVNAAVGVVGAETYIATARDAESVCEILRFHGVHVNEARIFDSLHDKTLALDSIASLEAVPPADVLLIDDSIENCRAATAAGYTAEWASWGYTAPGDAAIAREYGIRSLALSDLASSTRYTVEGRDGLVDAYG